MLELAFSIALMLAVVGGLSQWMIRKDRRGRAAAEHYRRLEFEGVGAITREERHAADHQ
jgi:hypothetical protein